MPRLQDLIARDGRQPPAATRSGRSERATVVAPAYLEHPPAAVADAELREVGAARRSAATMAIRGRVKLRPASVSDNSAVTPDAHADQACSGYSSGSEARGHAVTDLFFNVFSP
jgi:hypothetical protein